MASGPVVIAFQPLSRAHFPSLLGWLNQSHVRQFWGEHEATEESVELKYAPRLLADHPVRVYVIRALSRAGFSHVETRPDSQGAGTSAIFILTGRIARS
jgi:hypothetical protein